MFIYACKWLRSLQVPELWKRSLKTTALVALASFALTSEKGNSCLYGDPNESWEVTLPAEEVPPELPEPALGVNFAKDGMQRKDWLSLVAVHGDCWLLSVLFYFGARPSRNERCNSFP